MSYLKIIPVEFNHCDPAGIVFYPRYFEMVNSVVENFFADVIELPFSEIHKQTGSGIPAVNLVADFLAPTRLGDKLTFTLRVARIGGASLEFEIVGACADEKRLSVRLTVVWMVGTRATQWPDHIREKIKNLE